MHSSFELAFKFDIERKIKGALRAGFEVARAPKEEAHNEE